MTQSSSTANKSNTTTASTEKDNLVTQFEMSLIIFLLKKLSSEENPLSVREIKGALEELTELDHSEKTIRRKLQKLCALSKEKNDSLIPSSLLLAFGGAVVETTNRGTSILKYYFQPLLDASDVSMICGAIASNRYLTAAEKDYLLSREQFLAVLKNDVKEFTTKRIGKNGKTETTTYKVFSPTRLPEKPLSEQSSAHSTNLLQRINQLHDAVEKGYMIQVYYGIYTVDRKNKKRLCLQPRNPKAYLLNPYALLWNGGFYYLLATHKGHDNPVHFRVDRIMALSPLPQEQDKTLLEPRAALPGSLEPYFRQNDDLKYEFLPEKYTAMYPLMGIYDEADRTSCQIECTEGTMSILVDTFGSNLLIEPSPVPHADDELDIHGNPQEFYSVHIQNVQYDNILQFCLQQHASITALYPPRLIDDVETGLRAALERCLKARNSMNE